MQRPFIAAFLLLGIASFASACSCVRLLASCDQGWNSGEVVFFGKVVAITGGEKQPLGNGTYTLTDYEVHFGASEFFRGVRKSGEEAIIRTGIGGGDCGYPFVVGNSYLVYAGTYKGQLNTGICSDTALASAESDVLRELRTIRGTGHADDIFGVVHVPSADEDGKHSAQTHPLTNVLVHADGKKGKHFTTKLDERGFYAFASLPSGKYRLHVDAPAGLTMQSYKKKSFFSAEVKEQGAGCRVELFLSPDNRTSEK